jgi:hypothetical protein
MRTRNLTLPGSRENLLWIHSTKDSGDKAYGWPQVVRPGRETELNWTVRPRQTRYTPAKEWHQGNALYRISIPSQTRRVGTNGPHTNNLDWIPHYHLRFTRLPAFPILPYPNLPSAQFPFSDHYPCYRSLITRTANLSFPMLRCDTTLILPGMPT